MVRNIFSHIIRSALSYNPINLPKLISTSTGEERIWYTINGEKFKIEADTEVIEDEVPVTETRTRYLVQGFELTDGGAVHSFNFGDGRILLAGEEDSLASPRVQFHLKDH